MAPQAYRVKRKHLFLTWQNLQDHYSDRQTCLEQLVIFLKEQNPTPEFVSAAVEPYPTRAEDFHAHALLSFQESHQHVIETFTFATVYPDYTTISHGIQNLKRICTYFEKDGVFEIGHSFPEVSMDKWKGAFNQRTRSDADRYLQEHFPRDYIKSFTTIQAFLNSHYRADTRPYETPPNLQAFTVPNPIQQWIDTDFNFVN